MGYHKQQRFKKSSLLVNDFHPCEKAKASGSGVFSRPCITVVISHTQKLDIHIQVYVSRKVVSTEMKNLIF
jgi:hypothetical protein